MKLLVAKDPEMYAVLTTELAQKNVARQLDMEFQCVGGDRLAMRNIERDSSPMIVMFHAATAKIHGFTTMTLRWLFPNAKLVCLGSDTIWYRYRHEHEIQHPADVDLWLDTMDEVIEDYQKEGMKAKKWMWTISDSVLYYMQNKQREEVLKTNDFIGLFKVNSAYRQNLVNTIKDAGYSIIHGGMGVGFNLDELFPAYAKSKYVLGTTSPSWQNSNIRTMKGFRDWIGPACGTPIMYDSHPDVENNFGIDGGMLYNYDKPETIMYLIHESDNYDYRQHVHMQLEWLKENTLEKQLTKYLVEDLNVPTNN